MGTRGCPFGHQSHASSMAQGRLNLFAAECLKSLSGGELLTQSMVLGLAPSTCGPLENFKASAFISKLSLLFHFAALRSILGTLLDTALGVPTSHIGGPLLHSWFKFPKRVPWEAEVGGLQGGVPVVMPEAWLAFPAPGLFWPRLSCWE